MIGYVRDLENLARQFGRSHPTVSTLLCRRIWYEARLLQGQQTVSLWPRQTMTDQSKLPEYKQQAKLIFRRLTPQSEPRCSIESGACTLHYLISESIVYLTIADRSYPRKLAFSYLSELSNEFTRSYPPEMSLKAGLRPYAFVKFDTFIQRTKRLYLDPRGAEASGKGTGVASGLEQLNEDLQDVTRIMTKNMEDLLWRGDSLDRMSTMSSSLRDESLKYRKAAKKINTDALIRKWAPVGIAGLLFFVFVYYRFW